MKIQLLIALFCLAAAPLTAQNDRYDYIEEFAFIAVSEMERAGVPASIKLAQGILESNAGKSELASKGNNHFGIKCHRDWKGKKMYRKDDEPGKSCFRVYDSAQESYIAHTEFLRGNRRYDFLFEYKVTDYKKWAKGLKKAGYATSPTYAPKLIRVVETYELHKYDRMRVEDFAQFADGKKDKKKKRNDEDDRPAKRSRNDAVTSGFEARIVSFNDIKTVYAAEGESLVDIARESDIALDRIRDYNPVYQNVNQILAANDRVYLQPKRGSYRGNKKYHRVEPGETMEAISHQFGIRLRKLYKRNRLEPGVEVAAGQRVILKGKVKKGNSPKLRGTIGDFADPDDDVFMEDPVLEPDVPTPTNPTPPRPTPIPDPVIGDDPTDVDPEPTGPPAVYHTVRPGDTLYGLSKRYGTTVDALRKLNGLRNNTLSVGQQLRVK